MHTYVCMYVCIYYVYKLYSMFIYICIVVYMLHKIYTKPPRSGTRTRVLKRDVQKFLWALVISRGQEVVEVYIGY
jgi:hypothetical protein